MLTITALSRQVVVSRAAESGSAQSLSDEALIKAIADGDRRAMQMLYTRHNVRVYCFILCLINDRSLAEDLVSEVFLVVWRQAEGFKAKSQVSTWLLAIARYKALSALRRRSDEHLDDDVLAMIEDPADDPETLVEKEDRRAIFQNCLAQLLAARDDDIVTSEQIFATEHLVDYEHCTVTKAIAPCGHLGLFMGRQVLTTAWPDIARWALQST